MIPTSLPQGSSSLQYAEELLHIFPYQSQPDLAEGTFNADQEVVERFREAFFASQVNKVLFLDLMFSSALTLACRDTKLKKLTIIGGSLTSSPQEVDVMISSLKTLKILVLVKLTDDVMYSNLHVCFNKFGGSLKLSETIINSAHFAKYFVSSRITRIEVTDSAWSPSEMEKKRFLGSLCLCKALKSATFGEIWISYFLPQNKILKDVDGILPMKKLMFRVRRRVYLFPVQMPLSLETIHLTFKPCKLTKALFKALVAEIQPGSFQNLYRIQMPFNNAFLSKVLN